MACMICGSQNASEKLFRYNEPDKYELWMGIKHVAREWRRCGVCGLCSQYRNYPLSVLDGIYKSGYRDPGFRNETIAQAFERINSIPPEFSENVQRVEWLDDVLPMIEGSLLDIGAGIGVFAHAMRSEWKVACTEENEYSLDFIKNTLKIECYRKPQGVYDLISMVHVLEHISDPKKFLAGLREHTDGYIFIEVPDAKEFGYLPSNSDEFNSCHEWFFTIPTLTRMIESAGYEVLDVARKYYHERELNRLLVLAQCS